jgi:glycine/D-amino acid oxidase-like deaminating enzyme
MSSVSFWQDEVAVFSAAGVPPLKETVEAEVAVVGGGITGAAAALWLAREGADVALLEGRRIAAGASGRNGGFLLSGTAESYGVAVERFGRERTRRIWAFSAANRELATALVAELEQLGWPSGYRPTGSLRIAATASEQAEHEAGLALLREDGWQAELVTHAALPERLRTDYHGAIYYPLDGEIQPARFVRGLARLAQHARARVYEESPVTCVARTVDGFAVHTRGGVVRARHLLLAVNAWLPELAPQIGAGWLARAITPTRGQMLATAPVAERLFDCPCYADEGYQYWRQLPDGRLVVGGWRNRSLASENTGDETPNDAVQTHLERFVHNTLRLPEVAVEHRWAGIMAFSADGLPLIGALPGVPGAYLAGGYTGHGNAYALLAARVLADLIAGRQHAVSDLFDPSRFLASQAPRRANRLLPPLEPSAEPPQS